MLHRLEAARIRTRVVIALVAVEEAVREDLVADGVLRPVRRLVVLAVDRELVRLDAAHLELARAAGLRIVAVLLRVVEHELVAVEAVRVGVNEAVQMSWSPEVEAFVIGYEVTVPAV